MGLIIFCVAIVVSIVASLFQLFTQTTWSAYCVIISSVIILFQMIISHQQAPETVHNEPQMKESTVSKIGEWFICGIIGLALVSSYKHFLLHSQISTGEQIIAAIVLIVLTAFLTAIIALITKKTEIGKRIFSY